MVDLGDEYADLPTERVRPDLADLDTRSTREVVALIAAEDATVAAAVAAAGTAIAAAVDLVVERLARGGRLVYAGAGTPGRLGVLDAAECVPTFGTDPGLVLALIAGGEPAVTAAVEGAEDDVAAAQADVAAAGVGPDDVLVAVTASGRTPYAVSAARAARDAGAATVGVANNPGSRLAEVVDVAVEVLTGAEVIAGSTRLKAGTAQKLVLNAISTATMVRLGKTYGNLMVDLGATNEKLRARALRIVVEATGADAGDSAAALAAADGNAKTAIVALLAGVDADRARALLTTSGGRVRDALRGGGRTA